MRRYLPRKLSWRLYSVAIFVCGVVLFGPKLQALIVTPNWGSGASVSDTFGLAQANHHNQNSLFPLPDGGVVSIWEDYRSGDTSDLYIQKLDASGTKMWGAGGIKLSILNSLDVATLGSVDIDASSNIYITWSTNFSPTIAQIFAQKIAPTGTVLWASGGAPADIDPNAQLVSRIVHDNAGGAYVAYQTYNNVFEQRVILQHLDSNGNRLWGNAGVDVSNMLSYEADGHIGLVGDGNGNAIVLWSDTTNITGRTYIQKMDSSGTRLWGGTGVAIGVSVQDPLNLVMSGTDAIATWYQDSANTLFIQEINAAGVPQWQTNGIVISNTVSTLETIQAAGPGQVLIAWEDDVTDNTYANKLDTNGNKVWNTDLVLNDFNNPGLIASDGNGGFWTANESYDNYGVTPVPVHTHRYDTNGTELMTGNLTLSDGVTNQYVYGVTTGWGISNSAYVMLEKCPVPDCSTVSDIVVHRIDEQYQISSLASNLNVVDTLGNNVEAGTVNGKVNAAETLRLIDSDNNLLVAEVTTNMTAERNWSTVTGDSDLTTGKAVTANLGTAPGAAATHTLFIPKIGINTAVMICPNATTLAAVNFGCSGKYFINSPMVVNINSQDYFQVDNLTGTGGMGYENTTPVITSLNPTPNPVVEGSSVTLAVNFTDPGAAYAHTVDINWGDGNTNSYNLGAGVLTANPTHIYVNNPTPLDYYTINATVTSDILNSDTESTTITVQNSGTFLNNIQTSGASLTKTLTGSIDEPGILDSMTLTIIWGDGSNNSVLNLAAGALTFSANHIYTAAGSYAANLNIIDSDGGGHNYNITIIASIPPPPAPQPAFETINIISPSENAVITSLTPVLDWGDLINSNNVAQYQVYLVKILDANGGSLNPPSNFIAPTYLVGVVNDASITELLQQQSLTPGTYQWEVIAVDQNGNRIAESHPNQFTIKATTPVSSSSSSSATSSAAAITTGSFVTDNLQPTLADKLVDKNTPLTLAPLAVGAIATATVAAVSGSSLNGVITGIFLARRRKNWGIVFDAATNKPISLAVVRLFNNKGNLVTMAVSDAKGIYGLLVDRLGLYTLKVEAVGYHDHEQQLNLYTLDAVVDIALSPDRTEHNSILNFYIQHRDGILSSLRIGLFFSLIIGLIYSLLAIAHSPIIANYLILGVYGILLIPGTLALIRPLVNQVRGKVIDIDTGEGIGGVILRFIASNGQVMAITNQQGLVKINLPTGIYSLLANKEGYELISNQQNAVGMKQVRVTVNNRGSIDQRLAMSRVISSTKPTINTNSLVSPFGG